MVVERTPTEVAALLRRADPPILLDVRERWEIAAASIPGATPMPMSTIGARLQELPADREIVVVCHHGSRSAMVAEFLATQGRTTSNLTGGIDAWSADVDRSIPRY